jgi:hypothetical protein
MRGQHRAAGGQIGLQRALLGDIEALAAQFQGQAGRVQSEFAGAAPDVAQHVARPRVFGTQAQLVLHRQ